jgi:hypothetical protein
MLREYAYGGLNRALIDLVEVLAAIIGFIVQRLRRWYRLFIAARTPASNCRVGPQTMAWRMGRKFYEGEHCPACNKFHFVNPKTSKVLGFDEK